MDNAQPRRLLSLGTDRLMFRDGSAVSARAAENGKNWNEVHIIVAAGRSFRERVVGPNVFVYPTRSWFKALYPLVMVRLGRFIARRRGITMITCQDPFLTAMAGIRLKKEVGVPLEIQVHADLGSPNFAYSTGNKIRKSLALSYLPKADHIRVVSNRIKEYLVHDLGIDSSRIEVRPIAVDVQTIKDAPVLPGADLRAKYPQFKKIAFAASRLEPEKNIGLAVDAWNEVARTRPEAGLVIVGSGSQTDALKKRAAHNPNVVFEPWADLPTLYSYYKTADAFLVTSLFEGYGMTLVEAAAAGCPIVSTDVGVSREMGATIADWNAADFARAIKAVLGYI